MRHFLLFIALVSTSITHAMQIFESEDCVEQVLQNQNTQIQIIKSSDKDVCYVTVSPRDAFVKLVYRSYLFSSDGLFMVFNSFGSGPENEMTAAREFYRPLKTSSTPRVELKTDELIVYDTSGESYHFEPSTAKLFAISNTQIRIDPVIDPSNSGGIEILQFANGLLIEGGFKVGSSPTGSPSRSSLIRDSSGQQCQLKNTELFNYTRFGDQIWKFADTSSFSKFIGKRCPHLKY